MSELPVSQQEIQDIIEGAKNAIKTKLRWVRFPNNKAGYIIEARKFFTDGKNAIDIKSRLDYRATYNKNEGKLIYNFNSLPIYFRTPYGYNTFIFADTI